MRATDLPTGAYDSITDEQIRDAVKFADWHPNHHKWSEDEKSNPACHAYHILRLANAMSTLRCWCGSHPYQWKNGTWDGHHRKRAALYVETTTTLKLDIPELVKEDKS